MILINFDGYNSKIDAENDILPMLSQIITINIFHTQVFYIFRGNPT